MFFKLFLSFLLGIISLNFFSCFDVCSTVVCVIIAYNLVSHFTKRNKAYFNLFFIFIILGALLFEYSASYETKKLYQLEDKFIEMTGYVYDIPEKADDRYVYIIKTDGAKYKDKTYFTNELVRLNSDEKLLYSQNVSVRGFLEKINEKMNYSDFDSVLYNKTKGIFYKISDYEIATDNSLRTVISPIYLKNLIKNKISDFVSGFIGDEGAVLKAVLTGQKNSFSPNYEDILRKTHTMKMFYPAYLHIMLIMSISNIIMLLFSKKAKDYTSIILILVYAIFFAQSTSGLKTALAITASIIATRKFGYLHYPDVLSLVLLIFLIINPLLVYNAGFIVSSVMSWSFFMLRPILYDKLKFIKSGLIRHMAVLYIISTLAIIPLSGYYFKSVSIYTGLLNFIYFPLITIILLGFPFLCLEFLLFSRAYIAGYLISGAVFIMHKIPYFIEKLPFSNVGIKQPSIILIIALYLLIIAIKDIYYGRKNRIRTKLIISIVSGTLISSIIFAFMSCNSLNINFVNVGQGDGAYISLPHGENIIIDGGGGEEYSDYDAGESLFLPYLKTEGAYTIDLAILSHYHKDHCLGTIAALKNLNVKAIMMPDCMLGNKYRNEIEAICYDKNIKIIYPADGDKIKFNSGAVIDIISSGNDYSENDSSLVFTLSSNNFTALFTGDATKYTENKYIDKFYDVDLLKVAHHGSDTSTTKEFLEKIKPEFAVISVGEDNMYLLPDYITEYNLKKSGAYVMRTDRLGDIRFEISKNKRISYTSYYEDKEFDKR